MINTSLDLVPLIRGLESFSFLFFYIHLRWRMDKVRLYVASIIYVPFLEKEAPGSWNRGYQSSFNNDCDRQQSQSDFQMFFFVIVCFCLVEK